MDPLSIAAPVAGLTSFAVLLLTGCIKGFVLLSTARNMGKDAASIVCLLNMQEVHLVEWGRRAGLLSGDGSLDPRLNREAVEGILTSLQDLLSNTKELRRRYGLDLGDPAPEESPLELPPPAAASTDVDWVVTSVSDETRRRIIRLAHQDQSVFRRMRWATVDKSKIQQLVADVGVYIRSLWNLLDPYRLDDLIKTVNEIAGNMITWNDQLGQLMVLKDTFAALTTHSPEESRRYERLGATAEWKAVQVASTGPSSSDPRAQSLLSQNWSLGRTRLTDAKPFQRNASMGLARYDEQPVMVEFKPLSNDVKDARAAASSREKLVHRANALAAMLNRAKPETFQSLTCLGFVEEYDQLVFVFQHPHPAAAATAAPKSLLDLYSAKEGPAPSLTVRVQLALQIARIVRDLHLTGWLHKNIRSGSILFFARDEMPGLQQPLLAGFSQARLDSPSEISEAPPVELKHDIYRHPLSLGESPHAFQASMDIYALGTILLEIAEWRPLQYIISSLLDLGAPHLDPNKLTLIRSFLIDGKGKGGTARLRERAGDVYFSAVQMCLQGAAVAHERDTAAAEMGLMDRVVRRLELCTL